MYSVLQKQMRPESTRYISSPRLAQFGYLRYERQERVVEHFAREVCGLKLDLVQVESVTLLSLPL